MGVNDFRKFFFDKEDGVEIIRITVPQNLSDLEQTLLITVSIINILDLEEPFKVMLQYNLRSYSIKV